MRFSQYMPSASEGLAQLQELVQSAEKTLVIGADKIYQFQKKIDPLNAFAIKLDLTDEDKVWAEAMQNAQLLFTESQQLSGLPIVARKIFKMQNNFMRDVSSLYEKYKENPREFIEKIEELGAKQSRKFDEAIERALPEERQLYEDLNGCNKAMVKEVKDRIEHLQEIKHLNIKTSRLAFQGCQFVLMGVTGVALGGLLCAHPATLPIGLMLLTTSALYAALGAGLLGANVKPFFESKLVQKVLPYMPSNFKKNMMPAIKSQQEQAKFNDKRSEFVANVDKLLSKATQAVDEYKEKKGLKF